MSIDSNVNNPSSLPPLADLSVFDETNPPNQPIKGQLSMVEAKDSTESAPATATVKVTSELNVNLPQPNSFNLQNLNWGKFLALIWSTSSAQQEQLYSQESPSSHQKGMHIYAATEAAELAKIPGEIMSYLDTLQSIKAAQENANAAIRNYNSQMQQLTNQMNQAINAHNNGEMSDQDFANAVNSYNSQKASLTQQYQTVANEFNQRVNALNNKIDQLNALSSGWDIGTIDHIQMMQGSLNMPNVNTGTTGNISSTNLPLLDNIGNIPSKSELMEKLYNNKLESFLNSMKIVTQLQNTNDIIRDQHFSMLKLIFPNATVAQLLSLVGNTSVASSVVSLTAQGIQETLNKAIFRALIQGTAAKNHENLINQLQSLALTEISQASLYSVLGTLPTSGDGQAVIGNVAISFIGYISKYIKSDTFKDTINDIARENNLSRKEALALKAALGQTLWTVAISNLSQATGMYGLPAQLLGHLPNSKFPSGNEELILLSILFTIPSERKAFENELINHMIMGNRSSFAAAQIIAGNVVAGLNKLDKASPETIYKELFKHFNINFDRVFAKSLATLGLTTILNQRLDSELQAHPFYLSNLLLEGSLFVNLNLLANFSFSQINRQQFVHSMKDTLRSLDPSLSSSEAKRLARSIWREMKDNSSNLSSLTAVQSFLAKKLSDSMGLSPDALLGVAVAVNLGIGNVPLSPLLSPGKTDLLSLDALTKSLNSHLNFFYTNHGVEESEASKMSDAATAAVINNPHSMYNVMQDIQKEYENAGIQKSNDLWVEGYKKGSATSRDLAAFIASTMVNPLLYSQLVTISGGDQGEKFERPIQG